MLVSYLHNASLYYIIIYVNVIIIIIITINYYLLRHVSTCVGHFQVTVKRHEVFGSLLYLYDNSW
jgi:hypothetical protein